MPIFESGEDYLETILILSETQTEIHAIDIVNKLEYSKPSVSIALKKLKEDGYITIDEMSHIHLTEKGDAIAKKIYERHKFFTELLVSLGVDRKTAEEDACKIEHDISEDTFNAFKKLMK